MYSAFLWLAFTLASCFTLRLKLKCFDQNYKTGQFRQKKLYSQLVNGDEKINWAKSTNNFFWITKSAQTMANTRNIDREYSLPLISTTSTQIIRSLFCFCSDLQRMWGIFTLGFIFLLFSHFLIFVYCNFFLSSYLNQHFACDLFCELMLVWTF